jgi:HEPN domain-containing protein
MNLMMPSSATSAAMPPCPQPHRLQQVIDFIATAIAPEQIFLVNHSPMGNTGHIDLLIVISDKAQTAYNEYETIVAMASLNNMQVSCSLHQQSVLYPLLAEGHVFYSMVCTPANLVFSREPVVLPVLSAQRLAAIQAKARQDGSTGFLRAAAFLHAAQLFYQQPDMAMTAFMLQQAAELTFRAIVLALCGQDRHTHSIAALKKYSRRCAAPLNDIFPANTPEEESLLHLLEKAYIHARYDQHYSISACKLDTLYARVNQLYTTAVRLCEEKIKSLKSGG